MNTKRIILLSGLMIGLLSLSSFKSGSELNNEIYNTLEQDGLVVYAAYSGSDDAGYKFVVTDRNGNEQKLTFQKATDAVLAAFNLNEKTFIGTKFKVTFNRDSEFTKDAAQTDTIIKLEKL